VAPGLYFQLAWAADRLNRGYYLWRVNGLPVWNLADGSSVPIDPTINAGTAAIQGFFALFHDRQAWEKAVTENGFFATYNALFGNPFQNAFEPLIPPDLTQPAMQLPFEAKKTWSFTGGPHGGWGNGSAWAALDFAPPGKALGCVQSNAWVVAAADGPICGIGAVVLTWTRRAGTVAGVCSTCISKATSGWSRKHSWPATASATPRAKAATPRAHIYTSPGGITANGSLPISFVLDGWVSMGQGSEYDGYLIKNGKTVEAWEGRDPINAIRR
jgi:hypothetical protein